jgi:transcriptional regulator with XRE-family HTH domain
MNARRELTPEESKERDRLRKLWEQRKDDLHLTQKKAAQMLGFSNQTAISQYLNGRIPLNFEAVAKFCKLLKCEVSDVSTRFAEMVPSSPNLAPRITISSKEAVQIVEALNDVMAPHVRTGDLMVIDSKDLSGKGLSLPTGRIVAVLCASGS